LRKGFSLMELMVVVAIILILAGILLPIMLQARSRALEANCLLNLRQVNLALAVYRVDNDNMLPPMSQTEGDRRWRWCNAIYRYSPRPEVFECPANPVNLEEGSRPEPLAPLPETSYYYCGPAQRGAALDPEVDASQTIVLMDGWFLRGEGGPEGANYPMFYRGGVTGEDLAAWVNGVVAGPVSRRVLSRMHRHGGGVNAAFADGHCDWLDSATPEQFATSAQ
jgi:prepilin-type N-terminal cleavage/methylation domain-containing protein/prepilin-type processing-associated H-X9-DG protein